MEAQASTPAPHKVAAILAKFINYHGHMFFILGPSFLA